MSAQTGISWTDSTFNPWMGCTKVSPACDHCYAERDMDTRLGRVKWGAGQPRVRTSVQNWNRVLRWNHDPWCECRKCGWRGPIKALNEGDAMPRCHGCGSFSLSAARRRVFCASLADWLDNEVEIEWLVDLLDLIRRTPNLDWLLLSKRIGNWRGRIEAARNSGSASVTLMNWLHDWLTGSPPANVWLGSTVINQEEADRDVPKLLNVPARVRFLSIEPMLGPINLDEIPPQRLHGPLSHYCQRHFPRKDCGCDRQQPGIHWIICGGESGAHARPLDMQWVRSIVQQCKAANVPVHVKQMGRTPFFGDEGAGWAYDFFGGGDNHWRPDYRTPDGELGVCEFRDREGRDINEWPEDLRVQQFPMEGA